MPHPACGIARDYAVADRGDWDVHMSESRIVVVNGSNALRRHEQALSRLGSAADNGHNGA